MIQTFLKENENLIWYGIIIAFYLIVNFFSLQFVFTEDLYINSYSGQMSKETLDNMLGFREQLWWTGYLYIVIITSLKLLFAALIISIGFMLRMMDVSFGETINAVLKAESIFLVAQVFFLVSLYLNISNVTIENSVGYYPFSLLKIIGLDNVNKEWAVYPLQIINLFELLFIFLATFFISRSKEQNFFSYFNVTFPSYLLGIFFWVVFIVFLTLQVS